MSRQSYEFYTYGTDHNNRASRPDWNNGRSQWELDNPTIEGYRRNSRNEIVAVDKFNILVHGECDIDELDRMDDPTEWEEKLGFLYLI